MSKVLIIGGIGINHVVRLERFPRPVGQTVFSKNYDVIVGMPGTGKALNLSALGLNITLHGMLGDDQNGERVKRYFLKKHIQLIYDMDPQGTEVHINLMDDNGDRISIYVTYATFEPEIDYNKFELLIRETDYLILNINNYVRKVIPWARQLGKDIWCDIHDYDGVNNYYSDFIEAADYIIMSSNKMDNYKDFMKRLIDNGKKLVVCTHGAKGSTVLTKDDTWYEVPILDGYSKVDTNGAGDAYFSGLLYGLSKGHSILKAMRLATITAGLCITDRELAFQDLSEDLVDSEYEKHFGRG